MNSRFFGAGLGWAAAALLATVLFAVVTWAYVDAFSNEMIEPFEPTSTADISLILFERFVIPFEVVSFVLLAALIGGIALARKDEGGAEA